MHSSIPCCSIASTPFPPITISRMFLFFPLPAKFISTPFLSSHRIQRRRRKPKFPRASITVGSGNDDAFTKYSGYIFQNGASSEAEFLTEYNLPVIARIYRRKPFLVLRRFAQISATFGRWFSQRYLDSISGRPDDTFKVRAAELRMILLELGPAFVKIAQAVSSRPDVIPPAYLEELSLLQDRIAPFSTEEAFGIIEKELGMPVDMLFSEITPEPVAAASLGQVYQARLRANGKVVAVKVQRPGVQAAISLDIYILRYLAGIARRVGKLNTDLQAVIDEWASSLFREMDYRAEARNGKKFRELYGRLKDVFVPEMYIDQTSRRVLVMEWVEGQRLSDVKDLYLVEVGVYCSLSQLLDYGFYHADPHPGNLLRSSDGKLAYLDFGMMGEFKQELRDGFIEACLHLVNRDFDGLAKDFVTLGLLPPTAQKDEVTKALTGVFQNAVNKGVRNINFGDLSGNLGVTMYKFKFQIPSYFSLVIRSLAVLEGIAISFDPNYKVLSSSYPWIARKVLTDSSPKLRASLQTLLYKDGVFQIDRLESLLTESLRARTEETLDRQQAGDGNDNRTKAIKQVLSFTLTEKGAFVREILLQEIAKGIDALSVATFETVTFATASRFPFFVPFFMPYLSSSTTLGQEDITNLRTLRRLLLILSTLQKPGSTIQPLNDDNSEESKFSSGQEVSLVLNEMTSAPDLLPIISVIPELPSESQEQLLRLPVDLAGRLLSRAVARTIRRLFI